MARRRKGQKAGEVAPKKAVCEPVILTRDPDEFARGVAEAAVAAVNAERARRGLPPLLK